MTKILKIILGVSLLTSTAGAGDFDQQIKKEALEINEKVIEWRHNIHQHPELGNREFKTAALIAKELRAMGLEVQTNVAHTGVVAILKGGAAILKGNFRPTVALRADMDALPVLEQTGLSFASKDTGVHRGKKVPVMHACGHDAHVAILMGVAGVLSKMKDDIQGNVKFIFQPAEEGPPPGEESGAKLMIKQGVLGGEYPPSAIFGLHVWPHPAGEIRIKSRGAMAAADAFSITVKGRQTHGSSPWNGADPIIAAAHIMTALQLIPSRRLNITTAPSVITVGSIHGGVRGNIIPDKVTFKGTIRNFDENIRQKLLKIFKETVHKTAAAHGVTADIDIDSFGVVTYNDPALHKMMLPSLEAAADKDMLKESELIMGAEDFAFFQQKIPGLFYFLGVRPDGPSDQVVSSNHSPKFTVNDDALKVGVRSLSTLAIDYLQKKSTSQ